MKLNRRVNKTTIILFAIMFIGLGFAALSATLGITGLAKIGNISFDVHFENVSINPESMDSELPATINATNNTQIDFSLVLTTPGEYYEFEADIVNSGTLDAYLSSIEVNGLDEESSKYLDIDYRYVDGDDIKINDFLGIGKKERIKVRVDFKYDIILDDIPNEGTEVNFTLNIIYAQDNGIGIKRRYYYEFADTYAVLDSVSSRYVASPTGIDFLKASSDDNGKGLYVRAGTENDEYPILYFRGGDDFDEDGVEDTLKNHVLFGGYCWKIVRTTEQGGTKIIYDGIPNDVGGCNNTGKASQIGYSSFNDKWDSLAGVGYMYGESYEYTSWDDTEYVYGSNVTYGDGAYTLVNSSSFDTIANIKTKHYTCKLTTSGTCIIVYYVYSLLDDVAYAIPLEGGKKIEDVISKSFENTNDSTIKAAIDDWFKDSLLDQEEKLEDAVWCNDRSIASGGYLADSDLTSENHEESNFGRTNIFPELLGQSISPGLKDKDACPNKNDRFTKNDTINGNGALTYPIGLLTVDEATVVGFGYGLDGYSASSYLNSEYWYWLLSPLNTANGGYYTNVFYVDSDGFLSGDGVDDEIGVRPAVVLKKDIVATSGDGTATNPYVVE